MLNLIKYEFIKKQKLFGIVAISSILILLVVNFKYGEAGLAIFLGILSICLFLLYAVDIISMYSKELNSKTGYMTFMTPNSGYKILGSKVITAIIEGFLMLIFYMILVFLSFVLMNGFNSLLVDNYFYYDVSYGFTLGHLIVGLFVALLYLIQFLLTIYTAITIRKSILSNVKFKGLITFIIFIALNYLLAQIYVLFDSVTGGYSIELNDIFSHGAMVSISDFFVALLPMMAVIIVVSTGLTLFSGYLLENKINL